jgi:NADPH-dependent 2,4-dienoyl-CoA reductase/sulfur reductase-like enzyme
MKEFDLLIVGGGLTSARAIKEYRLAGGDGRVALLTREQTPPYHRPPLSKRYLRGEIERHDTLVEPEEFYEENDVDLLFATDVSKVQPGEHAVVTSSGQRFRYTKLLLAPGAVPLAPQVEGIDLPGVFRLRSVADSEAIREAAQNTRDAVVVGSGFIGMEVAASLTQLGLDVTLVTRDADLFAQLQSPEISEHLVNLYRRHGVDVHRGDEVSAFRGRSWLDTVELHSGDPVAAGLAVVGIGVKPAVSFLDGSGIAIDDGIVVDERFQTSAPDVYAAGDVARFFDPLYGRRRRIEHWSNANYQGAEVGKILAGADGGYDTVSTFFTESFGMTLKVFGDTSQHDDRIVRGSFSDGEAIAFYFETGRLVGTLLTGQHEATEEALKQLIGNRAGTPDSRLLADEAVPVDAAFNRHVQGQSLDMSH